MKTYFLYLSIFVCVPCFAQPKIYPGTQPFQHYYDKIMDLQNGMGAVERNDRWGVIDGNGRERMPCIYDNLETNDLASICYHNRISANKDGKYGVIDLDNHIIVPFGYDYISNFASGVAFAEKDGKQGYLDTMGKKIIPVIYRAVSGFSNYVVTVTIAKKAKDTVLPSPEDKKHYVKSIPGITGSSSYVQEEPIMDSVNLYFYDFIDIRGGQAQYYPLDDPLESFCQRGLINTLQNGKWRYTDIYGAKPGT